MTRRAERRQAVGLELVDADPSPEPEAQAGHLHALDAPERFEDFYRREFPRLVTLAHALAGAAYAADIAQESMIVAYRRWGVVQHYESPGGWVRGVCAHQAVSAVRRRLAEARAVTRLRSRRTATPDALAEIDEDFWSEVRRLPQRQAQAVAMHYALDLSLSDIAESLGCAEGTVKAHLFRAREALSHRLGVTTEEEQ